MTTNIICEHGKTQYTEAKCPDCSEKANIFQGVEKDMFYFEIVCDCGYESIYEDELGRSITVEEKLYTLSI